jgi:glycosyltransferase involved in cell wall biosynthesis
VGWRAVCRIALRHDVFVLTDIHNKEGWERGYREGIIPTSVQARFIRKPCANSENRFIAHLQSWRNCANFNRLVLDAARRWNEEERFDLCHQVTVAGWRMPSPLWQLPIPFIWGPIGGAGYIPPKFRGMLSSSARVFEWLRDVNTFWSSRGRAFRDCIRETDVVFVANEETEKFLEQYRGGRPMIRLPIASVSEDKVARFRRPKGGRPNGSLRLFAGGNMEGRKGLSLALKALRVAKDQGLEFHYVIGGGGPDIPQSVKLCQQLGLEGDVVFHPGFRGDEYLQALHDADVYFLPSFRESTPVTLLEACLAGCFPIVADTSAQGEIVRAVGGSAIPTDSPESLVGGLADSLLWCADHLDEVRERAESAAAEVAARFSSSRYDAAIQEVYSHSLHRPKTVSNS